MGLGRWLAVLVYGVAYYLSLPLSPSSRLKGRCHIFMEQAAS